MSATEQVLNRFALDGRVAVVTGCASGIGKTTALMLAQAGAAVVGLDRQAVAGGATAAEIENRGGDALFVECDVTGTAAVEDAFAAADRRFGRVDLLVNNAGGATHTHPEDVSDDEWSRLFELNVSGYFRCARAAGRRMIAQGRGGAIVNISSIAGSSALGRGNFVYSTTKGAVNQFTRELAIEWAPHRIRVNAVQPCQVRTGPLQRLATDPAFEGGLMRTFLHGIPLGRLAETEDIAAAVLFLASDAAAMVTGVVLPVDGGNLALNAGGTVGW
jgi:NAD(P)-dependent dehydrogenase (short-subunit alcohol dehydrogenase family)